LEHKEKQKWINKDGMSDKFKQSKVSLLDKINETKADLNNEFNTLHEKYRTALV
jgi:hypothetical protein